MPRRGDDFTGGGYVPGRGDVVHLNWTPSVGHEQTGPHYGLVLSQDAYNLGTGLVMVSPITSKIGKLSGFELPIQVGRVNGAVILSEIRTLDYQARRVEYEDRASPDLVAEAIRRVRLVL
ncbi:mRNA-degrading endonuclease [Azospirillum cavernae]|jgi:mRNA-degrading endonuclease toxin of MazEF toxin-antitoxin module|uniref:mRNA-degrading endonuclease n=1 Tax=Azospirillum cavernae TaxID=2320860 RepID=A0A418VSX7_9PROT|nr:type II toxin-antitoxin system PemK/MazF family toxin [Azospirillum cavernae]RJF79571.1 mRNA-degrading endonuclease [Azospirillum cavernae]